MGTRDRHGCRTGVALGQDLLSYSFPSPHPFTSQRTVAFWESIRAGRLPFETVEPAKADVGTLALFHETQHIGFVREASRLGRGVLDSGDTPAYPGVFEAALCAVGTTLRCVQKVLDGGLEHAFNPVGGLHHATRTASAGFCVFNDIGVAIESLRGSGVKRILYVDIDAHHGDGVYYSYESDPDLFIFDVHEDGRFLYPGTGSSDETGSGPAKGTKVNVPLLPGSGDEAITGLLPVLENFARLAAPEFIIFQCGADSLAHDPIAGLNLSKRSHGAVAGVLHKIAHQACQGRLMGLGGGGYSPENCAGAWTEVVRVFTGIAG